jgi:hypothetical protein
MQKTSVFIIIIMMLMMIEFITTAASSTTTRTIHVIPILSSRTTSHIIQHNQETNYFVTLLQQLVNNKQRTLSYPIHSMTAFYQFYEERKSLLSQQLQQLINQQFIFVDLGDEKDERHCIDQNAYVSSVSEIDHFLSNYLNAQLYTVSFNPNAWIEHKEWDVAIPCEFDNSQQFQNEFIQLIRTKTSTATTDKNEFFIVWEMDGSEHSYSQMDELMNKLNTDVLRVQYDTFATVENVFCTNCEQTIRVQSTPRNELEEELRTSEHAIKQMINTYKLSVSKMLSETRSIFHAAEVLLAFIAMKKFNQQPVIIISDGDQDKMLVKYRQTLAIVQSVLSSDDAFTYGSETTQLMKTYNTMLSDIQKYSFTILSDSMMKLLTIENTHTDGTTQFPLSYYSNGRYNRHSSLPKFISFTSDLKSIKKPDHDSSYNDDDISVPIVIFNDLSWQRSELVEVAISTRDVTASDFIIEVVDEFGDAATAQLIPNLSVHHAPIEWYRLVFLAKDVPALGTRVYFLSKRRKFGTHHHYKDADSTAITGSSTFMSTVLLSENSKFHALLNDVDKKDLLFNVETLEKRDIVLSNSKQSIGFHHNTGNLMFISSKIDGIVNTFFVSKQFFNYAGVYNQLLTLGSILSNDWLVGLLLCAGIGYCIGLVASYTLHIYMMKKTSSFGIKKQDDMSTSTQSLIASTFNDEDTGSFFTPRSGTLPITANRSTNNPFAPSSNVRGFDKKSNRSLVGHYQYIMKYLMSNRKRRIYMSYIAFSFGLVSAIITSNIIFHDELIITSIFTPYLIGIPLGILSGLVIAFCGGVRKWIIFGLIFFITYSTFYFAQPWAIATRLDSDLKPNDLIVFKGPLVHEMNQHYNSTFSGVSVLQTTRLIDTKQYAEAESTVYSLQGNALQDLQHDPLVSIRISPYSISGFLNGNAYETSYCSGLKQRRFRYLRRHNPSLLNYIPQTNVAIVNDKQQHLTTIASQHVPMTVFAGRTMEWMLPISSAPSSTDEINDGIKMRLYLGSAQMENDEINDGESTTLLKARNRYRQLTREMHHPFFLFTGTSAPTHYHIKYSTAQVKPTSKDGRITTEDEEHEEYEFSDVWKKSYQSSSRPIHPEFLQFLVNNNIQLLNMQYRTDLRLRNKLTEGLIIRFMRNGGSSGGSGGEFEANIQLKLEQVKKWFNSTNQLFKVSNQDFEKIIESEQDEILFMKGSESVATIVLI